MSIPPPPPGFTLDADDDIPPPPPGFELTEEKDASPKKRSSPQAEGRSIVGVVDGDTFRTLGPNVRLFGTDAPELRQPGYDRAGTMVPVGEQSRAAAEELMERGESIVGPVAMRSWGRPVAPIEVKRGLFGLGSFDAGEEMIGSGNAFAAPEYLADDPDYRFRLMQVERLARLNRQGPVHSTAVEMPEDYRKAVREDSGYVAPRETVAQFFDTPTPLQGMRPEVEQQYYTMLNDFDVPASEIVKFAKDNGGFGVDPNEIEAARERSKREGQPIGFSYVEPPQVLTDLGDGATGAAIRGGGSGFMAGGLDEAGAFVDMLGATPGRENVWDSERRLADIWANNRAQNASILGHDEMAHPGVKAVSELGGALLQPFPGGKFNSARRMGAWGGAYGGAEGFLGTEGDVTERGKGAAIGTPIGVAAGTLGGKAIEAAAPYIGKAVKAITAPFAKGARKLLGRPQGDIPPPPEGFTLDTPQEGTVAITDQPATIRMDQPLSEAQRAAMAQDLRPQDVLPMPSNAVEGAEEAAEIAAGRVIPAKAPDERQMLTGRTVRNYMGRDVPKVGPLDMVGYLRTQGGLADQGGELAHMGLTNAARKGMEHVGQEMRFGPLVNNEAGLPLDEAALRAWEVGYFPDHTERPSVNEFLDALRETHEGTRRRFLPEDFEEMDRFDAARADRMALEEEMAERGPLARDVSQPADAQPFPPVAAYEDWGPSPPDMAGNINLTKLESPQDISRALAQTERRVGFDAATRGRVTQAETERLAGELGMTPDKLLERRKGQAFNAEEALAARQLLAKSGNELVNAAKRIQGLEEPGDEMLADFRQKWMRHVAIQEQVAGATAEAGRALAQFRMAASSGAVRGKVLDALVRRGGGKDNLKDAAELILDAAEESPGKFNTTAARAAQSKWRGALSELYINNLLSNPATHIVNTVSNTLTSLAQIPEYATASAIGKLRQAVPGANVDRVIASEVGARAFGLLQGAKEGAKMFARALRTGEPSDFVSKIEGDEYRAIPGLVGEAVRLPTRFLTAEDEFFKGVARRMAMNGDAVRQAHKEGLKGEAAQQRITELMANPTDEMMERAGEYGRYLTFQNQLGPGMTKVTRLREDWPALKFFLPFVRTPTNLLKFAAERSPAAPLLKSWRKEIGKGGASRDLAISKAMIGTGMGMAIYEAALDGRITGSPPSDPAKARLLYADGWQPYSIKIGDDYYSYKRLDPFSTTLGVAADLATLPEGMSEKQKEDKAGLLVASIVGNLASKTWMSGVSDIVAAMSEPERHGPDLAQRLVGSLLVPAGVAGAARTLDPTMRQTDTIGEAVKGRIPFMRDDLLPRRDIWGEEIKYGGGLGPDYLSPVYTSEALKDPVNRELLKLEYAPGYPGKKVRGEELSPQDYDTYSERAGKLTHERMTALVTSPHWDGMDAEEKTDAAKKTVSVARKEVRDEMFPDGETPEEIPPPPPGFSVTGEAAGRNVYRDLQEAIPGVQFTSGFRDEAYQEDMRRRGYNPARDSRHLDGSSFDLLPPPGKSMAWLKERVRQYDPDAELLDEGDHLHVTFPGYFGAPPIGGAQQANLRNPYEGMPPPPPGFAMDAR